MKQYLISKTEVKYLKSINALGRRTGKSTALALDSIVWCIRNPNKELVVFDHLDSKIADRHLLRLIQDVVNRLELSGFSFNRSKNTLKFRLYE